MTTYKIPLDNLQSAKQVIETLNSRASLLGAHPIQVIIKENTVVTEPDSAQHYMEIPAVIVEVPDTLPDINGWVFVAVLTIEDEEIKKNIVTSEYSLSIEQWGTLRHCQCCAENNLEKSYTLYNKKTKKWLTTCQSCLPTTTECTNSESVLIEYKNLNEIHSTCSAHEKNRKHILDKTTFPLNRVLLLTAKLIGDGGLSKKEAVNFLRTLPYRVDIVKNTLYSKKEIEEATPKQTEIIKKAVDWAMSKKSNPNNEYLRSLRELVSIENIGIPLIDVAVSLIPTYYQYTAPKKSTDDITDKTPTKESLGKFDGTHIGTLGKRIELTGEIIKIIPFVDDFGVTLKYVLINVNDSTLLWKTTTDLIIEEDLRYTFKATIKAHSIYRGERQTEITRVKFNKLPDEKTTSYDLGMSIREILLHMGIEHAKSRVGFYPGYFGEEYEDQYADAGYSFDTKQEAVNYAKNISDHLKKMPAFITMYQSIVINGFKNLSSIKFEHLDLSWTTDKEQAITFDRKNKVLIQADVPKYNINFRKTIKKHIAFKNTADIILNKTSEELLQNIAVYNSTGTKLLY